MATILQDFTHGIILSIVSIVIVFLILYLLTLSVSLLKKTNKPVDQPVETDKPTLRLEDITDPDMMVAALVASIDYQEEIKKDIRLVSIKEITQ